MFNNPKELKKYWNTAYYLEYSPYREEKEVDDQGNVTITKIQPSFSSQPVMFRYKPLETSKEEYSLLSKRLGVDVSLRIETRSDIDFKQDDLILDDLELLPYGQTNRFGLNYANWSRVADVKIRYDEDYTQQNLMFKRTNQEIKEIIIG